MAIEDLQDIDKFYEINIFVFELKEDDVHAKLTLRSSYNHNSTMYLNLFDDHADPKQICQRAILSDVNWKPNLFQVNMRAWPFNCRMGNQPVRSLHTTSWKPEGKND